MRIPLFAFGTLAVFAWGAAAICAQQSPRPAVKILIAGENPGLRFLDKEGGKAVTEVNFWRAQWSPVGVGAVCFVTVREGDPLRVAITDNTRLADYIANQIMGSFGGPNRFNNPPYEVQTGTISQTNVGATERTETCRSSQYNIVTLALAVCSSTVCGSITFTSCKVVCCQSCCRALNGALFMRSKLNLTSSAVSGDPS